MAVVISSFLLGAILGLLFEVLILVPAVLIAAMLSVIDGWVLGLELSGIILMVVVSVVALQLGYLCPGADCWCWFRSARA